VSQAPGPDQSANPTSARDDAVAVISAYGAFRLVLVLMAIWSFFEGFALFVGLGGALTLGGSGTHQRVAEQIIGAHMMLLVPVYALLAWRRDRYRSLMWIPYAAQLAMIVPLGLSLLRFHGVGILLLVVSLIFFSLLVYFWWQSKPLEFFQHKPNVGPPPADDAAEERDADDDAAAPSADDTSMRRRYRRQ
jgi:hypothetical protein